MSEGPRLRVLIADDEPLARARIEDLLRDEEGVEVVGQSEDGAQAVEDIRRLEPDLVFLDIQMPRRTGLEVVSAVGPAEMPATIFVTAFDQHALKAFDLAAVDYLVKPFDDERFAQALARARERIRLHEVEKMTRRLMAALGQGAPAPPAARITVESRGQTRFVPIDDIDYVTASGPYAELHAGGQAHLIRERMHALEERLPSDRFFRLHRSAIVQLDRIASLRRKGGETSAVLRTGEELPVARNRRQELEKRLLQVTPAD